MAARLGLPRSRWALARWSAVVVFAAAQLFLALDDTPTADEARHLRDGATILRDGRIDVNPEHPPLVKLLAAAALPPSTRAAALSSLPDDPMAADARFAARLPLGGATGLRARLPPIFLAVAGLLAFGLLFQGLSPEAAAAATVLLAFAPAWLAQGHYVTTDVAPIAFLLCAAWAAHRLPTTAGAALSGVFLGAALVSKFSAPLLAPFLLLWILAQCRKRGLLAAMVTAFLIVVAVEAFAVREMSVENLHTLSRQAFLEGGIGSPTPFEPHLQRMADAVSGVSRPLGAYAIGFLSILGRGAAAEGADYWAGRIVAGPQPLYVIETLVIKNDLPLLIAAALGAAALWTRRKDAGWGPPIALVAGAAYFVAACRSSLHLGARYMLPLIVLFAGLATAMALRSAWRPLFLGLIAAHVLVAAAAFPHYVSYRNLAARWIVSPEVSWDFGEDWGQDLGRALRSEGRRVRYLSLLHYRESEWRTLFPLLGRDDDDSLPWLVDRLALNVADAAGRPDVPPNASRQIEALRPLLERIHRIRKEGPPRPTSEPTLFLIEPPAPRR